MKEVKKRYDLTHTSTCAVNCPFMTSTFATSEFGNEETTLFCEKYQSKLFQTEDKLKVHRAYGCKIQLVEWVFYFDE